MVPNLTTRPRPRRLPTPPGPRSRGLIGLLPRFGRDPLGFLDDMARSYGDVVRYRLLYAPVTLLNHPDAVKHVLQDNHRRYGRNRFANGLLKVILGDSLLTTEGDYWLRQRRLVAPAFHRQRIAGFGRTMTEAAEATCARWDGFVDQGQTVDLAAEMMRLTLRIVGLTLFSEDLSDEANRVSRALADGFDFFSKRMANPIALPLWVPTRSNRRYQGAAAAMDALVYRMIAERRAATERYDDLLTMLVEAHDEATGETMSDLQVRNEAFTMLTAGHETTANALSWCFYLLAQNPEAEARLHSELSDVLGGRTPTMEDLPRLPYTRRVLDETMRLYPPAWIVTRQANEEDEIAGYRIPKGSPVHLSPWTMHRHPALWEEPTRFDPDRFLPDRAAVRPKFAYFPFGGGPHLCIGNQFALTEAQLVLATLAQGFRLRLVPGHPVELQAIITLRPRHGLRMSVARRA